MPTSRQRLNMAAEVASSASPPNDMVPMHKQETRIPVRPSVRYSIFSFSDDVLDAADRWLAAQINSFNCDLAVVPHNHAHAPFRDVHPPAGNGERERRELQAMIGRNVSPGRRAG